MISDKSSLASRLGWIMGDIGQAIEQARLSFEQFAISDEGSDLSACRENFRQVNGVLDILGADGAHMFSQEILGLLDALLQGQVENRAAAKDAIAEGLLQLTEYLKHLQEGYADLPVIILPALNNLRAARDAELLSEHLVFLTEDGHASDDDIGTDEYVELPIQQLQQVSNKLRFYVQKALLGWFRQEQPERMLQAIGKVTMNMVKLNRTPRLRSLWWISSALTEALAEGKLEQNAATKMLMGRLEREIRDFGELGETAYNKSLSDELLKNLLYYIGLADSGATMTDKVKAAYHLDVYLPRGENLTELRQYYTMPGRDLWQAVSTSVIDELKALQVLLEGMQDEERQSELLSKLAGKTEGMSSTLAMLGLGRAAELTNSLSNKLHEQSVAQDSLGKDSILKISAHYARLEKVLQEYGETGYDATDEIFSQEGENCEPATERSVLRNTLSELGKVQNRMVAFYKEGWAFVYLEEVITSLESISGALAMAQETDLQPLADVPLRYIREDLLAAQRQPTEDELAVFADIMTLFEAMVSSRVQQEDHLLLLDTALEKLQELDQFSPLALLEGVDVEALRSGIEAKKKARPVIPARLTQRLQMPLMMSAKSASLSATNLRM